MKLLILSCLAVFGLVACGSSAKKKEMPKKEEVVMPAKKEMAEKKPMLKVPMAPKKTHWGYTGAFGPQFWGNLDSKFSMCKDGKSQSPINLVWSKQKMSGSELSLAYKESKLNVLDNGHSIQFNVDAGSFLNHNSNSYQLKQFHFHSTSEHQLSGKSFPLEMHLVHQDATGSLAVLGVLFKEGKENPMFKKLFSKLPTEKMKPMMDPAFIYTASVLVPAKLHHYMYEGSLTTPPCTEGVKWFVLNTPVELSKAQIDQFKALYSKNNRPIQPTNGRAYSNY